MAADPPREDKRDGLDDTPPFLTWKGIYLIVLGALAAQIAFYMFVTWALR